MNKTLIRAAAGTAAVFAAAEIGLQAFLAKREKNIAALPGNDKKYNVENLAKHAPNVLNGKTILFLGSSVTYGAASQAQSFVELFRDLDGVNAVKEAVSATTLTDKTSPFALLITGNGGSYISRMKRVRNKQFDCVVCQLSTNDATMKMPLGEISPVTFLSGFDTKTVTGAIEYIISYCQDRWQCPVVFYTGSYYESAEYSAMVKRLHELQDKWGVGIIDMYTDEAFNAIDKADYDLYMHDPIHPTKAGYVNWWFPKMEESLIRIMTE